MNSYLLSTVTWEPKPFTCHAGFQLGLESLFLPAGPSSLMLVQGLGRQCWRWKASDLCLTKVLEGMEDVKPWTGGGLGVGNAK